MDTDYEYYQALLALVRELDRREERTTKAPTLDDLAAWLGDKMQEEYNGGHAPDGAYRLHDEAPAEDGERGRRG